MCNVRAFQRQIIGSAQLVMRQFQDRVRELKRDVWKERLHEQRLRRSMLCFQLGSRLHLILGKVGSHRVRC
jgi:hypothetical protein